jgi:hypothetical protein
VIDEVVTPSASTEPGDELTVDCVELTAPALKVTAAVATTLEPSIFADTVAVAALVDEVRVAVYVPLPLSVTDPSDPAVVASVTVPPLAPRFVPALFFNVTVIADVLAPFAVIALGAAVTAVWASEGAPVVATACAPKVATEFPATSFSCWAVVKAAVL